MLGVGGTAEKASPVTGLERSKGEGHVIHTSSGQGSSGLLNKSSSHEYVVLLVHRVRRMGVPGPAGRLCSTEWVSWRRQMWAPVPVWLLT